MEEACFELDDVQYDFKNTSLLWKSPNSVRKVSNLTRKWYVSRLSLNCISHLLRSIQCFDYASPVSSEFSFLLIFRRTVLNKRSVRYQLLRRGRRTRSAIICDRSPSRPCSALHYHTDSVAFTTPACLYPQQPQVRHFRRFTTGQVHTFVAPSIHRIISRQTASPSTTVTCRWWLGWRELTQKPALEDVLASKVALNARTFVSTSAPLSTFKNSFSTTEKRRRHCFKESEQGAWIHCHANKAFV